MNRLILGGAAAFVMLVVGELAPGWVPVRVVVDSVGGEITLTADGSQHTFKATAPRVNRIELRQPGPAEREYQVDGSDVTSREDRDPAYIRSIQDAPLYRAAAWLRDEASFSRWEQARLTDLADGRVIADGNDAVLALEGLPAAFRLEVALRRPEAEASLWLVSDTPAERQGLELNRDRRAARWLAGESGSRSLGEWYFPEQWPPFAAALAPLITRSLAAGYLVLAAAFLLAASAQLASRGIPRKLGNSQGRSPGIPHPGPTSSEFPSLRGIPRTAPHGPPVAATPESPSAQAIPLSTANRVLPWLTLIPLAGWLAAATWVTVRLYAQIPHIVDAVAYQLQANIFRAGHLWFEAPPLIKVFRGYQQAVLDGRWFAQYAPGAPLAYAAGGLIGLDWLVGPIAAAAMIGATYLAGRFLFGPTVGLAALGLGLISPFILFQAGAFLSHAVAGAWLAAAIAAFAYAERSRKLPAYALAGVLLGAGFVTREAAGVLVGLPLGVWLLVHRRWAGLACVVAAGLPFLGGYLWYNAQLTGDPFLLPRFVVDPNDRFGFAPLGVPNHHTVAAGLANTDENLTLLQFDLFGWPPLLALSLLSLPFVLGRADKRDVLLAAGVLAFVVAHVGYFYHGIVLGPRYYFEAVPWLLLLAARGLQAVSETLQGFGLARAPARLGVIAVVGLLSLNTALYYVPRLVERRTDYVAMARNPGLRMPFVQPTLTGPRLDTGLREPTLVLVNDERLFKTLFPLNCRVLDKATINQCQTLFVGVQTSDEREVLTQYPGRTVLKAQAKEGAIVLEPYEVK